MWELQYQYRVRKISSTDRPFLLKLYTTTRQAEMDMVNWTDQEKNDFIAMQFNAQHRHYTTYYPNASFEVIEFEQTSIGRIYLDKRDDEIRIVDIALLPEYCGKGIGSMFLENILLEAQNNKLAVRIHVENYNPALRLYKRLGFHHIDTNGVYHLMEWSAAEQDL